MAKFVEARVGVRAEEQHGQQRDQRDLNNAEFRVSSFEFQVMCLWETDLYVALPQPEWEIATRSLTARIATISYVDGYRFLQHSEQRRRHDASCNLDVL